MCIRLGGKTPSTPPPPPLPPPIPPPEPPKPPAPEPQALDVVNPQVRRAQSKKVKNAADTGTGSLRIKRDPQVNIGIPKPPAGGMNT